MLIVKNKILPLKGFTAVTIWPFIFHRDKMSIETLNHEMIHARQQKEMGVIGFYPVYLYEWIRKGYQNISFEKEAYQNEKDQDYLKKRKFFNWIKY